MIPTVENPGWLEVTIHIDPMAFEAASDFLFGLGCAGVVTETVSRPALKAYLPYCEDWTPIKNRIHRFLKRTQEIFPDISTPECQFTIVANEDWSLTWRRFFRKDQVTPELMIIPAWEDLPETPSKTTIRIDPGPAFGTGQHPTTRLCLAAMETIAIPASSWRMADVGTGCGILAIYGVKLGAERVLAIDTDKDALKWAHRNIMLNQVASRIVLSSKPIDQCADQYFMVAANLILGTIMDILPHLSRIVDGDGFLILSGILQGQVAAVKGRLPENGLKLVRVTKQEEWSCILSQKRV